MKDNKVNCPNCQSKNTKGLGLTFGSMINEFICKKCGYNWDNIK